MQSRLVLGIFLVAMSVGVSFIPVHAADIVMTDSIYERPSGASPAAKMLKVQFIDVGGGDGIIIETPSGKKVLIDGGYSWGERGLAKKEYLAYIDEVIGSDTIDLMVISHPDYDHFSGLAEVYKTHDVLQVWASGYDSTELSNSWRKFDEELRKDPYIAYLTPLGDFLGPGSTVRIDDAGTFGNDDDTVITIINTQEMISDRAYGNTARRLNEAQMRNSTSIVLRLDFGVTSFLFTGDVNGRKKGGPDAAHDDQERFMVDNDGNPDNPLHGLLDVDVLKVPHHGSDGSASLKFLQTVSPDWAVIPAGNPHDHPHVPTLRRLEDASVGLQAGRILRTDDGDTGSTSERSLGDDTFVFALDPLGIVSVEKWDIKP